MSHWTFWEWIAYGALAITAASLAIQEGLNRMPTVRNALASSKFIPAFLKSSLWAFMPLVLLSIGSVIFLLRESGVLPIKSAVYAVNSDVTGSIASSFKEAGMPPWLRVALAEYDVTRGVNGEHNPRIMEYLKSIPENESATDEDDWASAFAEWCLDQVGLSGPKSDRPRAWVNWGREIKKPQLGAIAIFNFQGTEHVGFVLGETPDSLVVIGGNEVDRVQARRYYKKNLVAYRMPPTNSNAALKAPAKIN